MFKSQFINSTFDKSSNKAYLFNIKINIIRTNEII